MKSSNILLACGLVALAITSSCGSQRKLAAIRSGNPAASLVLGKDVYVPEVKQVKTMRDTLRIKDDDGRELMIMKAIRDEDTGDMVATETLDAAMVTARFRNIAERHGKVDLAFQIIVPAAMQDSKWQLRFYPDMYMLGDVERLEPVIITGNAYRKAQLKGYQQYERFLSRIVEDTTRFVNVHALEIFLKRNIPILYALKTDSTFVSDEQFYTMYGVSEQEAVEHYTNKIARSRNERRKGKIDEMYAKYVKVPIVSEGIRLDTVMVDRSGDFIYNYVQTIATRPRLRKVDIVLSGDIYESDRKLYEIPESDPLTFYISSLSAFVDGRERYLDQIVSRRVDLQSEAKLLFEVGDDTVREELGDNLREIIRIRSTLASLLEDAEFDLDSIVVTAHASPEGSWRANGELSQRRGRSVGRYFAAYMKQYADSADRAVGYRMNLDGTLADPEFRSRPEIHFSSYAVPENWDLLDRLVAEDRLLAEPQKMAYQERRKIDDPDRRELAMRADDYYPYLSKELYPRLRSVVFDFRLHRRNMLQDTIHTTVLDTAYMAGVQAIRDRDYKKALTLLRPYEDFNTAIAYCCLDYNASALSVLEKLDRSAEVNYMLALVYARQGDERSAVECYLLACAQNGSFVHRGNLDPEISALIRKYDLNRES